VSPTPPFDGGYSNQGKYPQLGSTPVHAQSSAGSPGPAPHGHGYQPNYAPAAITRRPVPNSPASLSPPPGQEYGYGVAPGQ